MNLKQLHLGETFSFVLNSPYAIANKVMDVMAGFGVKLEKESKEATRPEEHRAEKEKAKKNGKTDSKKKKETKSSPKKKKTAAKKTAKARQKKRKSNKVTRIVNKTVLEDLKV